MDKTRTEFETQLEAFRAVAEGVVREHFRSNGYTFAVPNVEIAKGGRKFIKLLRTESNPETSEQQGQTFVHSFVEVATGDIRKAASFKAPAKHARGNIWDDDAGRSSMSRQGHIKYLH